MQKHVIQLTKQRLSDFFVKEDGHVAHKNALVAGTVATGAILASVMLTPDTAQAGAENPWYMCGESDDNHVWCLKEVEGCYSGFHQNGDAFYFCEDI